LLIALLPFSMHNGNSINHGMLVLSKNPDTGMYDVCFVEGGRRHCATVKDIKEAYAAQAALQRAVASDKLAVAKWDNTTADWDGGGDAA
jgi:hypothetical protein